VEIAQKDMCCVQMIDVKTKPHAYAKFNCASNVQMCIVCRDRLSFKRPFEIKFRARDQRRSP